MTPARDGWAEGWIGLPYAPLGRGPGAYDCLGLFLAVQRAEFGLELSYGLVAQGPAELAAHRRYIADWVRVEQACPGDAVLMRRGRGWHIGCALDDRRMLHAVDPGSVIEPFRSRKWGKRLEGIYRHARHR